MTLSSRVQAWDAPTRVFKWLLVATVAIAWATNKYAFDHPDWHKWNGYAALILVVFRVFWGFSGGYTARFSSFVARPATVAKYAWAEIHGSRRKFLGHNPLGGWMIVTLLCAVGVQAILGLFSAGGDYLNSIEGPLAHLASDASVQAATRLHRLGFSVILGLVSVHVAAIVFYDFFRRTGLIHGMITGNKPQADYVDAEGVIAGSVLSAATCFVAAILAVFVVVKLFS